MKKSELYSYIKPEYFPSAREENGKTAKADLLCQENPKRLPFVPSEKPEYKSE